jgi:hypothetical protein
MKDAATAADKATLNKDLSFIWLSPVLLTF